MGNWTRDEHGNRIEWVPTQREIERYLNTLPAATYAESANKLYWGISKVGMVKTYIKHHPELGYPMISSSQVGSPRYLNEERHQIIEPDASDYPYIGTHANLHNARMRLDGIYNELQALIPGVTSVEKFALETFCDLLQPAKKYALKVENGLGKEVGE